MLCGHHPRPMKINWFIIAVGLLEFFGGVKYILGKSYGWGIIWILYAGTAFIMFWMELKGVK